MRDGGCRLVFRIGERNGCREDVVPLKTGSEMEQVEKAAQHQAGSDQEHAGEAHFRNDERIAKAALMAAANGGSTAFMQTRSGIGTRCLQCGDQTEKDSSSCADDEGESEDRGVYVNLMCAWKAGRKQRHKRFDSGYSHGESERASDQGDQQTLAEELPYQAGVLRSECKAHSEFALAGGCSGQHEICRVGTRDQEHHSHCSEENQQHPLTGTDDFAIERDYKHLPT